MAVRVGRYGMGWTMSPEVQRLLDGIAEKAACAVRGFRAVYLGLFFNCLIMSSVNLAACKIAGILIGLPMWQTLTAVGLLNVVFAAHAGL